MKTLYIDCSMGAAGDMLTAALLELAGEREKVIAELNSLGIPGITYEAETAEKCGITGTRMHVLVNGEEEDEHMHEHHDHEHHHDHEDHDHEHHHEHNHHHHHSGLHDIEHIVNEHIQADDKVRKDILNVYKLIAAAESEVHGMPIDEIHFHEVGTMDAIADVAAVCYLINRLNAAKIYASPVHVGKGTVKCAHGILPVPAPATALLLKGIPIYSKEEINGELCTPTGAALLKYFVSEFKPLPLMSIDQIGYGMGTKDFTIANCLRILSGESQDVNDQIIELSFNVDDMTGEQTGFLMDVLFENGARDVFTIPVGMKKNRPGTLISVICSEEQKDKMVKLIFVHSTTIGIRETVHNRYILDRKIEEEDSSWGKIRKKVSSGYGVIREKYEYDDLEKLAKENKTSIEMIKRELKK